MVIYLNCPYNFHTAGNIPHMPQDAWSAFFRCMVSASEFALHVGGGAMSNVRIITIFIIIIYNKVN